MIKPTREKPTINLFKVVQSAAVLYLAAGLNDACAHPLSKGDRLSRRDGRPHRDTLQHDSGLPEPRLLDTPRLVGRSASGARVAESVRLRGMPRPFRTDGGPLSDEVMASLMEPTTFVTHPTLDLEQVKRGWTAGVRQALRLKAQLQAKGGVLQGVPVEASRALLKAVVRLEAHLQGVLVDLTFPGDERFEFVSEWSATEGLEHATAEDYEEVQVKLAKSTQRAENLCEDITEKLAKLPTAPNAPHRKRGVGHFKQAFAALANDLAEANDGALVL